MKGLQTMMISLPDLVRVLFNEMRDNEEPENMPANGGDAFDALIDVGGDPRTVEEMLHYGREAFAAEWERISAP